MAWLPKRAYSSSEHCFYLLVVSTFSLVSHEPVVSGIMVVLVYSSGDLSGWDRSLGGRDFLGR